MIHGMDMSPSILSAENCSSLSKRHGQAEENVSDWRGWMQEGEHGTPVHRGIARSQRSRWDTLQHHKDPSVSPVLLDAVKTSIEYQTKDQTSAAAAVKLSDFKMEIFKCRYNRCF